MQITRREFAAGLGALAVGCAEHATSPSSPGAQVVTASQGYRLAVRANQSFRSVLEAFDAANVDYGPKTPGRKLTRIGGTESELWKIDINGVPFCVQAGLTPVPMGATIACYFEDARKVVGTCLSDNPF